MTIGTRKHRFDGLGAGVAKEVFQLRAHLAAGSRVAIAIAGFVFGADQESGATCGLLT